MLKIGDKAPLFSAKDQTGQLHTSQDYRNSKLVIYFYPKDMTPGCTVQAKNLSEHIEALNKAGYKVLGVSADSIERHCKFVEKHSIAFPLLVDEEMEVIKAFEAFGPKQFMGKKYNGIIRKTFVIDQQGLIVDIIDKVKTKAHAEQILKGRTS